MIKNISNLGDAAVYCDFGPEVNKEINLKVISYFNHLNKLIKDNKVQGIINLTPSYNKLIINFDLAETNFNKIKTILENINIVESKNKISKKVKIPVCCDNEFALDLEELSKRLKISTKQILDFVFSKSYYCYMTGFIAGMPFLGYLNEKLRIKRLATPRVKVPKGSIGLTEQFCNIYTYESPGGWNIIGNTPLDVFDKDNQTRPMLINPGDKVKFNRINQEEYDNIEK